MKKLLITAVFVGSFLFVGVGAALADPIYDKIDFTDSNNGKFYIQIQDTYTYYHVLDGIDMTPSFPLDSSYSIDDATLTLVHWGNQKDASKKEVWISQTNTLIKIGDLSQSDVKVGGNETWVTDTWNLTSSLLDFIILSEPWKLTINLFDSNTGGTDNLWIDYSIFEGNYHLADNTGTTGETGGNSGGVVTNSVAPVPEPATMFLFGTGLVGLAGAVRRRKKK